MRGVGVGGGGQAAAGNPDGRCLYQRYPMASNGPLVGVQMQRVRPMSLLLHHATTAAFMKRM